MTDYAAKSLYAQVYKQGQWHRVWSTLTRRHHQLLSLAQVQATGTVCERAHTSVQTVPIDRIQDSENRVNDFDLNFCPRQDHNRRRWLNVASARLQGKKLPAVELIQVGGIYFCRDGHHRISVARALEQQDIEAKVTVWQVSEPPSPTSAASHGPATQKAWAGRVYHKVKENSTSLAERLQLSVHHLLCAAGTKLSEIWSSTRPIAQDASY
jgi:hypothetical protein